MHCQLSTSYPLVKSQIGGKHPFPFSCFSGIMKWGEVGKNGERIRWVGKEGEDFLKEGELAGNLRRGHQKTHLEKGTGIRMFLGEYEHTIDSKGRLAVPAKFRAQMDQGAVISKGMGTCLSVYTTARWEEKSAELVAGKSSDELRDFERRIYPSASESRARWAGAHGYTRQASCLCQSGQRSHRRRCTRSHRNLGSRRPGRRIKKIWKLEGIRFLLN